PNPVVARISNEKVAASIKHDAVRAVDLCRSSGTAIARKTANSDTCDSPDHSGRDAANPVILSVGYARATWCARDGADSVNCNVVAGIQLCRCRGSAVA